MGPTLILSKLRVWGGGIYQPSDELTGGYDFYPLCDELGILVWSELVFSDSLFPLNDFLLDNIAPEVRQNVRRTNKHPSTAQWAAGNEAEVIVVVVNTTLAAEGRGSLGQHFLDEVSGSPLGSTAVLTFYQFQVLFGEFLYDLVSEETRSVGLYIFE